MDLYEIVKMTRNAISAGNMFGTITTVVTATMDKKVAEQMLTIYQQNANENESYQIRTLREKVPSIHLNLLKNPQLLSKISHKPIPTLPTISPTRQTLKITNYFVNKL